MRINLCEFEKVKSMLIDAGFWHSVRWWMNLHSKGKFIVSNFQVFFSLVSVRRAEITMTSIWVGKLKGQLQEIGCFCLCNRWIGSTSCWRKCGLFLTRYVKSPKLPHRKWVWWPLYLELQVFLLKKKNHKMAREQATQTHHNYIVVLFCVYSHQPVQACALVTYQLRHIFFTNTTCQNC